jgi:hypothetical protein
MSANEMEHNLFKKPLRIISIIVDDKFTRKALLCNTQYLYTVDSDSTTKSHTECIVVSTAKWLGQRATLSPYTYGAYLV